MRMKSLLERLKPEIKSSLLESQDEFPNLVSSLISSLEDNVAITELTFGDINNLTLYSPTSISSLLEVYDMFED